MIRRGLWCSGRTYRASRRVIPRRSDQAGSGKNLAFDIENRLVSITSPAFSAAYAPDDRRASKTANGATTYYLYDEDGGASPLLEEQGTGTVSMGYGQAADGLRARYAPASGGLYYLFQWDPQGSLVQRQTGGTGGAANTSYYALDTAMFDGYGAKLGDTDAFTGGAEATRDAMGFQGQFGAYTDNETGLVLMGHRYYDAGTGRFLTRDPLGYGGGINLYGFTGNNPVNESDPFGLDWLDNASNFSYGAGGIISGGLTNKVDHWLAVDGGIDRSSKAYHAGVITGYTYVAVSTVVDGAGVVQGVRAFRAARAASALLQATGGAARAATWSANWSRSSLAEAIARHAGPNATSWVTNTGKRIFENPATGRQVVEDLKGGYFTIFQPKTIGSTKGVYLNLLGNVPSPARYLKSGAIKNVPLTGDDLKAATHFLIK